MIQYYCIVSFNSGHGLSGSSFGKRALRYLIDYRGDDVTMFERGDSDSDSDSNCSMEQLDTNLITCSQPFLVKMLRFEPGVRFSGYRKTQHTATQTTTSALEQKYCKG